MSEDAAWERIEKAAEGLVEKSRDAITIEKAVDRYLRTPQGRADYERYMSEFYSAR
jgi:hypothetical protein